MNYSLFQNIENFKINTDPFPHIIIENALNDELYEKLSKNFPKENDFKVNFTENNKRDDIYIDSTKIKELDKDVIGFINYHGSKKFWEEVVHFFGKHIIKLHNNIFSDLKVLENLSISNNRSLKSNKISLKDIQAFNNRKIFLHSSVSINTPVHKKSNVRGVHLDKLNKLYGGLFYLRHPADNSTGGDLEILK